MNSENIVIIPPVYESLFDINQQDTIWPESILNNSAIQAEFCIRKHLLSCLRKIFTSLPHADMEVTTAIDTGLITSPQAKELYIKLAQFLEDKKQNARIILYLPFELIPNTNWQTNSISLTRAITKFHATYLSTWQYLLSCHDIRACFADGDVLEPGLSKKPLPKVVKAAHLAWVLVSKGLITTKKIINLIENSRDGILRQSLTDAVKVMYDLGLIDLDSMFNSSSSILQKLGTELNNQINTPSETSRLESPCNFNQLEELTIQLSNALEILEKNLLCLSGYMSDSRIKWLRQKDTQVIIKNFAKKISHALVKDLISVTDLKKFIQEYILNKFLTWVMIETIGNFLEEIANKNIGTAHNIYNSLEPELSAISNSDDSEIIYAMKGMHLRLSFLRVIDKKKTITTGEGFLLGKIINETKLDQLIHIIEADNQLSKMIYPTLLIYGSQVKGYGNSDFDLAILIRPWVDLHLRPIIQETLVKITRNVGIKGSFLEFWLEWESGRLKIRDFKNPDTHLGGNDLAHVLFEAAWIGQPNSIKQIFGSLISDFLLPKSRGIIQAIRPLLLKEIEHHTLQFRLMHRGYAHMYPPRGGITTRNSFAIDSESSFWDSGYRQLATKLFVSKVFLPKLKPIAQTILL